MKLKRLSVAGGLATLLMLLSGCVRTTKSGHPYGFVYTYMAKPMQHLMEWLAAHLGNNYGWAIIVIVVVVRMVLLPVMFSQMKKSTIMQEKMARIQPVLKELQQKQKEAKTPEETAAIGQQMMAVYRENNVSLTGGIGCLPLIIQLPVFAALYAAIRYSPDLYHATFFGIALGKPSVLFAVLSFIAYAVQSYLGLVGVPESQKQQMKMAIWMSPVMTFFISLTSSAGLGLYFFIGGLFAILQTLLINAYRPRIRKQIAAENDGKPVKVPDAPVIPSTSTTAKTAATSSAIDQLKNDDKQAPSEPQKKAQQPVPTNRQRNAGKQHHHKSNN
ncbi:Oxa1 family cytochrome oxidase biogenesis protein [Limosilactobacillus frumenti DSM 13145]|uniref:Oxa1 family cytochrome oxidase biogenesis protein n=1 Tax=Limosilactobacillus frumenti DSM 13145 TaxID=1423746 RepID=A0A0R1P5A6_9LACO|nr:membrane protein insertase YidC [Limosilactobacillus frumenti]KRL27388.1 Oxa1 family cytochrome oxidase biogenesis protein [Limosilactobacillus frumenti DSM 13145]MBA2913332.1 membrane protein insertase YidC [Limosilactobacillus frumenti]QFG72832.1 membrane protein insertase YidC [Limosilactobacillus frumenti]